MDSVFWGLNDISHLSAHEDIFPKSWSNVFDASAGVSTIIYRLMSSANRQIVDLIAFTLSFI